MEIYRSNKIMIGQRVYLNGKKKTVVAICMGAAMLSDKDYDELQALTPGQLDEQLKKDYSEWIDLDKIEINGKIICPACRRANCSNNETCINCNEKLK